MHIHTRHSPMYSYMSKTGCHECSGRNKTGILHEISRRIQWDHSRTPKQIKKTKYYGFSNYLTIFTMEA